jgi:hypothetical protein
MLLVLIVGLMVEGCVAERPGWYSDRGAIGGALRDPLTHEIID